MRSRCLRFEPLLRQPSISARFVCHSRLASSSSRRTRPAGQTAGSSKHGQGHSTKTARFRLSLGQFRLVSMVGFCLVVQGISYYISPASTPPTLNDETFAPYKITAREAISPTSYILTITPHHPDPNPPYLTPSASTWLHSHWSLEIKQPQVQISRHYTPLPPLPSSDPRNGSLRFYIRTVGDGEMSGYLSRLREGEDVWLRGPHVGFDMVERLGKRGRVVCLAGGTGVAPAMQAAHTVLGKGGDVRFDILWAVRTRWEIYQGALPEGKSSLQGFFTKRPQELDTNAQDLSPIATQLKLLKEQYGERLRIRVSVDEGGTFFQPQDLSTALQPVATRDTLPQSAVSVGCTLHDPKMLPSSVEFGAEKQSCRCQAYRGAQRGKDLLIVSGPDGFINHFAGPKLWHGGKEMQGNLAGVIQQLQKQNPHLAHNWLVLKL